MSNKIKLFIFLALTIFFLGYSAVLAADNLNLDLDVYTCNNNAVCDAGENSTDCAADCAAIPCGNGVIDLGEQCDNGSSNGPCPASCSASCNNNSCGGGGGENPVLSITGVAVNNITNNSAIINWLTSNSATCQLVWGLNTDYAGGSTAEVVAGTSHTNGLSGLLAETTYHFKISCTDTYNASLATIDHTFITSSTVIDLIPPENIMALTATPGNKHILLSWINPTDTDFAGVVIRRSTDYFPALTEGSEVYNGLGEVSGGQVIFDDTGLTNDTLYYYSIFAYDTSNNFASGVGTSATPRQATTTPNNVTGLRIIPSDKQLSLYWTNPLDIDLAGVIIRRSTVGNPSFTSGALVFDGTGYPSGTEFSFPDTGLTNNLRYYYTVFAYNNAGYHASGVSINGLPVAEVTTTTPPIPTTTPPFVTTTPPYGTTTPPVVIGDLFFKDFNFYQNNQTLTVDGQDVVSINTDQGLLVSLNNNKVLPGTEKIVLNLSVNAKVENYLFSYLAEAGRYSASLPGLADEGKYWATIIVLGRDNQTIKTVYGWIEVKKPLIIEPPAIVKTINEQFIKPIQTALKPVQDIAKTPAGQTTAAATVAVSIVNIAIAVPWWNWWYLLQFIFTQPFQLFFRRKGWGVVYNSITKKPVDLALVRLYDTKTNKLIASKVTDHNGRYIFFVDAGDYYLKVEKPGFEFPSKLLKQTRDDGNYLDLYYGNQIKVGADEKVAIVANIPLDQEDKKISDAEIIRKFSKQRISQHFSLIGPIIAVVYLIIFPSWFASALVVIHILVLIYFRRAATKRSGKNWGIVYDVGSKKPLKQAITRIFSSEYGRMLEFYVTDSQGRYGFLVGENKYYVMADKDGYDTAKTPIIDLSKVSTKQEMIAKDLGLVKSSASSLPTTEQPPEIPTTTIESPTTPEIKQDLPTETVTPVTEVAQSAPVTPVAPVTTSATPETKPAMPALDLGSIGEIKETLNIAPETETQKQKMDLDETQNAKPTEK